MDSNQSEKARKKYAVISPSVRMAFIKKVLSKQATIKQASQEFGIKFSTSKAILQTYRREGRVGKKKTRQRKSNQLLEEQPEKVVIQEAQKKEPTVQTEENLFKSVAPIQSFPLQQMLLQQMQQQQAFMQMNMTLNSYMMNQQTLSPSVGQCIREIERQRMINMQLMQMIEINKNKEQKKQEPKQFGLINENIQGLTPLQSRQQLDFISKNDGRSTFQDFN